MLTVIVPIYNEKERLEIFIKSLFDTFKQENVEYIFINDGSNDGSAEWLSNNLNIHKVKNCKYISLSKNRGKGYALRKGLESVNGDYILFIDSDMEYNPKDGLEMLKLAKSNTEIKVLFGSRYLSGKIQHRRHILNDIAVRLNTFIFNFLFDQHISDLHCGTKLIHKNVFENIKLSINDFGFEIDISSKIAKTNFKIYEYGISYIGRTFEEGKKITWIDGLLSYFYLFKTRFIENDLPTFFSIIYASVFMGYVGSFFGMGQGKILMIIILTLYGLMLGLKNKIFSTSFIIFFIYLGSLFSKGNGKIFTVLIFFLISLYIVKKINNFVKGKFRNKFINFFL